MSPRKIKVHTSFNILSNTYISNTKSKKWIKKMDKPNSASPSAICFALLSDLETCTRLNIGYFYPISLSNTVVHTYTKYPDALKSWWRKNISLRFKFQVVDFCGSSEGTKLNLTGCLETYHWNTGGRNVCKHKWSDVVYIPQR